MSEEHGVGGVIVRAVNGPKTVQEILCLSGKPFRAAATFYDQSGQRTAPLIKGNVQISKEMLRLLEAAAGSWELYFVQETQDEYIIHPGKEPGKTVYSPSRTPTPVQKPWQMQMRLFHTVSEIHQIADEGLDQLLGFLENRNALGELRSTANEKIGELAIPGYEHASNMLKESTDWQKSIDIALLAQALWRKYKSKKDSDRIQLTFGTLFHKIGSYLDKAVNPEEYKAAKIKSGKQDPTAGELSYAVLQSLKMTSAAVAAKLITNHLKPEQWIDKDYIAQLAGKAYDWYYADIHFLPANREQVFGVMLNKALLPGKIKQVLKLFSDSQNYIKSE